MKTSTAVSALALVASTLAHPPNHRNKYGGPNGDGCCPPNFKNAVLNGAGDVRSNATFFINPVLDAGATNWITFQLNITGVPTTREIPMMAFASMVADAVALVNGPNPPQWLLTFNEPDYSYMNFTPTLTPQEAADAIKPLLASPGKHTKFVAPVTADPQSDWLPQFYAACNCKNFFSAYNIHVYQPTVVAAQSEITAFHNKFPDKPLWVTEIAPGSQNPPCSLSWEGASEYMREIYSWGAYVGYIGRIFWNTINEIPGDNNVCNSYLISANGYPSPLLETYRTLNCTGPFPGSS